MYSYEKFYKKDYELLEIHFPVRLGGLKGVHAPGENSNILDFIEIKIIFADVYRESGSLFGSVHRFDYWQLRKVLNHILQVLSNSIIRNWGKC